MISTSEEWGYCINSSIKSPFDSWNSGKTWGKTILLIIKVIHYLTSSQCLPIMHRIKFKSPDLINYWWPPYYLTLTPPHGPPCREVVNFRSFLFCRLVHPHPKQPVFQAVSYFCNSAEFLLSTISPANNTYFQQSG
jgi:hypothetical protein